MALKLISHDSHQLDMKPFVHKRKKMAVEWMNPVGIFFDMHGQ